MATIEEEIKQPRFLNEYQKLGINLIYTHNWLTSQQAGFFKSHDITMQQFNVLRILRGQHPMPASVNLIKERMLDKMSDVSRIVERLRQAGYVCRATSEHDRRSVDVSISEKGLALLAQMDGQEESDFLRLLKNLSEAEAAQLNALLDKIRG